MLCVYLSGQVNQRCHHCSRTAIVNAIPGSILHHVKGTCKGALLVLYSHILEFSEWFTIK